MSIVNLFAALAVMYVLWTLMVRKGMKNLTCHRSFSRTQVCEGEEAELVEVVRNDGPYIIPWLRVESHISEKIRLGKQENLHSSNSFYRSCFTLMPYQQIRRRHYVKFLGRGVYDLGNASLGAGDLLGMTRFWKDQHLSTPVVVYPRIPEREDLPFPLSKTLGDLVSKNRLLTDPFLVRSIRPYQPGDLIRDIHWAATARTEEVQVRVHDHTISTRLLVVLNAQRRDNQWDNYIGEQEIPLMEEEIRLAAGVCVHALREGLAVGFATNMPREQGKESTLVMPGEGEAWEHTLLDAFARLTLHCSEKFIPMLESLQQYQDMDILILSPYSSDSIEAAMEKLVSRGNQVTFIRTEGGCL